MYYRQAYSEKKNQNTLHVDRVQLILMYPLVDDREETARKYDDVERPTHDLQQNTYGNELRPLVNDLNENRRNQGKSIFFSLCICDNRVYI